MKRIPPFLILLLTGLGMVLTTWLVSLRTPVSAPKVSPSSASSTSSAGTSSAAPISTPPPEGQGEGWNGSTPEPSGTYPSNLSTAHSDQLQLNDQNRDHDTALEIAKQFVAGWGDPTDARQEKLVDITYPSLYNELINIPPNRRNKAQPSGEPAIVNQSSNRIIIEQPLQNRETIWILLTDDPTAPRGWYVVAVEPEPAA